MKIVASHQPHFNPYLGYFAKMKAADTFVFSDDVQFTKNGFIHRNKVRSWQRPEGWRWLTMPVNYGSASPIKSVTLAEHVDAIGKIMNILAYEYHDAPHFAQIHGLLSALGNENRSTRQLSFFNYISLALFGYAMGMIPRVRLASSLKIDAVPGDKNGRLIAITKAVGGDTYLAGSEAARAYLDPRRFADAGITLLSMEYLNPEYPQVHGGFMSRMGVIDALMNTGNDARRLISAEHYRITEMRP